MPGRAVMNLAIMALTPIRETRSRIIPRRKRLAMIKSQVAGSTLGRRGGAEVGRIDER
jgi:hypothetical protein